MDSSDKGLRLSAASLCSDVTSSFSRVSFSPVSGPLGGRGPSPFSRKALNASNFNKTFIVGSLEDEDESDTSSHRLEHSSRNSDSTGWETIGQSIDLNSTYTIEAYDDEEAENDNKSEIAEEEEDQDFQTEYDLRSVIGCRGSINSNESDSSYYNVLHRYLESDYQESGTSASSSDHGSDTTLGSDDEASEKESEENDSETYGIPSIPEFGMHRRRIYSLHYTRSYLEKLKVDENSNSLFTNEEPTFNGTLPSIFLETLEESECGYAGNETHSVLYKDLAFSSPCLPPLRYARMLDESVAASTEPFRLFDQPKVVEAIIRGLDNVKDIIHMRLVNSIWRNAATAVMHERNKLFLEFNGILSEGAARSHGARIKEIDSNISVYKRIDSLCSVIENSIHFPVYRFAFREINLEDAAVERFFKLQGPSVRYITFRLHPGTKKRLFWRFFYKYLVNIQLLELINFPLDWKKDNFVYEYTLHLPHLQVITFGDSPEEKMSEGAQDIIHSIIQGTDNLIRIINFPVYLNSFMKAERKFNLIHTLNFYPDPNQEGRSLEEYAALSRRILQLHQINILSIERHLAGPTGSMTPEEGAVLEDFLCFGRKSLKVIHTQPLGNCPNLKLHGTYSNLDSLHLHCFSPEVQRRFSLNTSLFPNNLVKVAEKFPKLRLLEVLGLECKFFASDFPSTAFPPGTFPTVTELLLRFGRTGGGSLEEWERFAGIVPNVKLLTLDLPLSSLGECLSRAWKSWNGLEKICIYIKEDGFQYKHPFLDEIITGIEEKYCRIFRRKKKIGSQELIQSIRQKFSVLNMPNLKKFKVVFESKEAYDKHIHGKPGIISEIASWHGFCESSNFITGSYKCKPPLKKN